MQRHDPPFEPQPLVLPDCTTRLRQSLMVPHGNLMQIVGRRPRKASDTADVTGHPGARPA